MANAIASGLSLSLIINWRKLVKTFKEIQLLSGEFKLRNKKIVFTNGCFDILHAGHVEYLEAAKALGDILIVGINSDRSVKLLKGKDRPINKLDNRSKVLSSLKCVDKVVVFNDETPLNLIKAIKPDVLVKGGDYKVKEIVGYKEVIAHEGTVVTIDLVEGLSTSKIISKLA